MRDRRIQQPAFGVVQTAALLAPRRTPYADCRNRVKTRLRAGSNGMEPEACAKDAQLRFVAAE